MDQLQEQIKEKETRLEKEWELKEKEEWEETMLFKA